ncbi:MAG TPA: phospholipid carrier-dependent glycosyltransferase [Micromonosporaceae bacterium]|nr:phospholipid carrier-dependent glycosyltransferase [Micromonosporaceae bacterium]
MSSAPLTDDVRALAAAGDTDDTAPRVTVPEIVRRRLAPRLPDDSRFSWIGTAVVVAIAGLIRLVGLSHPPGKIFDEIYYATEGNDLFRHGVEWNATQNTGDFVVHPPLGKWLIGTGEWFFSRPRQLGVWWELLLLVGIAVVAAGLARLTRRVALWASLGALAIGLTAITIWAVGRFEPNTFGWRIMPAIFGTAAVLITIRVTRRMFRSTVLGLAAGLLMAFDGMEFILSRTALLDIFLMFFILAAFACLVMDRDQRRRRWLTALENGLDPSRPGRAGRLRFTWRDGVPWWRLAAAVMTGCAMSVKWSALWYIIVFVALIFFWSVGARRTAGVVRPWRDTFLDEGAWIIAFGLIIIGVYLASWSGWFATSHGYDRNWYQDTHGHSLPTGINAIWNLIQYHWQAWHFHDTLTAPHRYQSWPWQWLLLGRPVAFYYSAAGGCGVTQCSAEVLLLGTPVLWWSFLPALTGIVVFAIARRDWRASSIFWCAFAGIVPWFIFEFSDRTMFYFYALPAEPFLVMAVVFVFGVLINGPRGALIWRFDRRAFGSVMLGLYLLVVAWCFAYFYPIYVGEKITYAQWFARMWLGGRWI